MDEFVPSLERRINQYLDDPDYRPLTRHELAAALKLSAPARRRLRAILRELQARGEVVCLRKNRWARPSARQYLTGQLSVHRLGFGFVSETPDPGRDVYVDREDLRQAQHGDLVQVELTGRRPARGGGEGLRGRIARVVERRFPEIAGVFKRTSAIQYLIPADPRFPQSVRVRDIAPAAASIRDGDLGVVRLDAWDPQATWTGGVLIENLGAPHGPASDLLALRRQWRLDESFEPRVEAQAEAIRQAAWPPPADARRRDLRDLLTFTIDPEDARDFDDAISIERGGDGSWRLGVHIADVSHYVAPDSEVDREARRRGTTVYLVDRAILMLPPRLTVDVCSLAPDSDRLCHSCVLTLDESGRVISSETFPSRIRSRARLTYEIVQRWMDTGEASGIPPPVADALAILRPLARRLRERRLEAGALDFDLPEVRFRLDAHGRVLSIRPRGAAEAYHLIEECMLLANQAVARRLTAARLPTLYRVHESPGERQWGRLEADLDWLGARLRDRSGPGLNEVVRQFSGSPLAYPVALACLRNLQRARYAPVRLGHFGLAMEDYTHFTSPIRRYPDLLVHRQLKALEEGRSAPYSHKDLAALGAHCSETERDADEAERQSVEIQRIAYYRERLAAGDTGPYPGVVVASHPRGWLVELPETLQRGLISFSDYPARGESGGRGRSGRALSGGARIGRELDVDLIRVDAARRLVDFRPSRPAGAAAGRPHLTRGGAKAGRDHPVRGALPPTGLTPDRAANHHRKR